MIEELEEALSPKQKKVVNFLVGKVMARVGKNGDPKFIRQLVIAKLSILTYEEEDDGCRPEENPGS